MWNINDMQILKGNDLISLCSAIYQVLSQVKSKDQDFQINIPFFLVIKLFTLLLINILNVNA